MFFTSNLTNVFNTLFLLGIMVIVIIILVKQHNNNSSTHKQLLQILAQQNKQQHEILQYMTTTLPHLQQNLKTLTTTVDHIKQEKIQYQQELTNHLQQFNKELLQQPYTTMDLIHQKPLSIFNPSRNPKDITISVLIPIYNGEEFFTSCLQSILQQTSLPNEILIGINGHAIDSALVQTIQQQVQNVDISLRRQVQIQVFVYEKACKTSTLNALVREANSYYVALLDVDDEWLPEKLYHQRQILTQYDLDVVGTHCQYIGDSNTNPYLKTGFLKPSDLTCMNHIINSSMLIKKTLAVWDALYTGVEDYELWLRLNQQGCNFYNIHHILVHHRIHKNSSFNSKNQDRPMDLINKFYLRNNK